MIGKNEKKMRDFCRYYTNYQLHLLYYIPRILSNQKERKFFQFEF